MLLPHFRNLPQPAPAIAHRREETLSHPWMEVSSASRDGGLNVPSLPSIPLPSHPTPWPSQRPDESISWLVECFQNTRLVQRPELRLTLSGHKNGEALAFKGLTVRSKGQVASIHHTHKTRGLEEEELAGELDTG